MSEGLTVTDARGRVIKLRELDPGDMLDLIEAAPQCDAFSQWLQYAQVMYSVDQIGDIPIPRPTNKTQVKAIARQLGNDGLVAVSAALFGAKAETPDEDALAIKN